jgi:hypothetical protein
MKKYCVRFKYLGEELGYQIDAPNKLFAFFIAISHQGVYSNYECEEVKGFLTICLSLLFAIGQNGKPLVFLPIRLENGPFIRQSFFPKDLE